MSGLPNNALKQTNTGVSLLHTPTMPENLRFLISARLHESGLFWYHRLLYQW